MVDGRPSLKEFLQFLEVSSRGVYPSVLCLAAILPDGTAYSSREDSRVSELNDSMFTDMADLLADLVDEDGRPESPDVLAGILLSFINDRASEFLDVPHGGLSRVSIVERFNKAAPKVGAILAVPTGEFWCALIMVARNRFGVAFGIFGEKFSSLTSVHPRRSAAYRYPIYSDDSQVINGTWSIVGHDEDLLSIFPAEPEIYHSPALGWPDVDFGQFGAAETPAGEIRLIDRKEAEAVGIIDGSYRQVYPGRLLQQSLGELMSRR
jgi:hypothetical protein